MERLGLEEGEEILPGIVIQADGGVTGNFRILCDGDHDAELEEAEEEVVDAVADDACRASRPPHELSAPRVHLIWTPSSPASTARSAR